MRTIVLATALLAPVPLGAETPEPSWGSQRFSPAKTIWTAEMYSSAEPMEFRVDDDALIEAELAALGLEIEDHLPEKGLPYATAPSGPPSLFVGDTLRTQLFEPLMDEPGAFSEVRYGSEVLYGHSELGKAVGASKAHFTSTQVYPPGLEQSWPWLPTGKLFALKSDGATIECSGAVIAPRLVLTAGHCVHSGFANGWFVDFRFIPGFRDAVAPVGVWQPTNAWSTQAWMNNRGKQPPNAADFAIIEIADEVLDGQPVRIGDVTGWYGFATLKLKPNHLTLLGYPGSFDGGLVMHQCSGGHARSYPLKNEAYGCDMTPGSSGGPWIQNFGVQSVGQQAPAGPVVVGVTSWARTQPANFWVLVSSPVDGKIAQMRNVACGNQPGNC